MLYTCPACILLLKICLPADARFCLSSLCPSSSTAQLSVINMLREMSSMLFVRQTVLSFAIIYRNLWFSFYDYINICIVLKSVDVVSIQPNCLVVSIQPNCLIITSLDSNFELLYTSIL